MPSAGFWAIGGYTISFRSDGNWYADDEVIANPKIARLFSKHVRSDGQGGWVVDLGIDCQPVVVQDTALVVTSVDGDSREGFVVTTNDGLSGELDCATLVANRDNVLYCSVDRGQRGRMRARFLRPAYYRLAESFEDASDGPLLRCRGRVYAVAVEAEGGDGRERSAVD